MKVAQIRDKAKIASEAMRHINTWDAKIEKDCMLVGARIILSGKALNNRTVRHGFMSIDTFKLSDYKGDEYKAVIESKRRQLIKLVLDETLQRINNSEIWRVRGKKKGHIKVRPETLRVIE